MKMLNSVDLVGRLTRDVDLRYTPNGNAVATFILAVQHNRKNKDGEYGADFFRVEVWRKPAENVSLYCKKGSMVAIHGGLRSRNYEVEGEQRMITYVLAQNISYLDSKNAEKNIEIVEEVAEDNSVVDEEEISIHDRTFSMNSDDFPM